MPGSGQNQGTETQSEVGIARMCPQMWLVHTASGRNGMAESSRPATAAAGAALAQTKPPLTR